MGSEVGLGEMVTSFRGWEGVGEGRTKGWEGVGEGRAACPSLPVLHMSLESLGHVQELYYSYEDCLRNAYSM